jgi:hypothetical protein
VSLKIDNERLPVRPLLCGDQLSRFAIVASGIYQVTPVQHLHKYRAEHFIAMVMGHFII